MSSPEDLGFDFTPEKEILASGESESPEEVGGIKGALSAIPRGLVKGIVGFGRMMGPLEEMPGEEPYDPEKQESFLGEYLQKGEGFVPGAIERAGEILPYAVGTPGGAGAVESLVRTGAAGVLGETAKAVGLPEWAQSLFEIPAFVAPNLSAMNEAGASKSSMINYIKKVAPESISGRIEEMLGANKGIGELLEFAREMGMTEGEITPLLQGKTKLKWLSRLASKGESMTEKLKATKKGIGTVYDSIRKTPAAKKAYSPSQRERLIKGLQEQFDEMPHSVRNAVKKDYKQLLSRKMTGNTVMKFYQDVGHELGPRTKQLSLLKNPIKKSLMELDSRMGHTFDMTNKLSSKFYDIAKRLKPGLVNEMISEGKAYGALYGVLTGDLGVLQGIAGITGAKKLAENMLTSPRLQGLGKKMVNALNSGKLVVAKHIKNQMADSAKDYNTEIAADLEALDLDELLKKND